jgi:hypothetical protein
MCAKIARSKKVFKIKICTASTRNYICLGVLLSLASETDDHTLMDLVQVLYC